jgi:hypothetical protein
MNPVRFWLAIITLLGFVAVIPAWLHFAGPAADPLPGETEFLVATFLPLALLLTLASWVQPG